MFILAIISYLYLFRRRFYEERRQAYSQKGSPGAVMVSLRAVQSSRTTSNGGNAEAKR